MKNKITKTFLVLFCFFLILAPGISVTAADDPIELRMAVMLHINTLDPISAGNNWEYVASRQIYDTLIYPDPNPKVLGRPWIANSWKISNDLKTYTFYLKKGLIFHDGSEITAEDVAFSMDRQQTLGGSI